MTTLGPICSFLNGGTPSRGVSRYYQGDIPWITGADISGARADTARSFITEEAIRESATNRVPARTVLLVTRTSVGKVAVAAMELCFSQDITAITPDPHCLDTSYLVHFLRTKQPHLERLARGATIKGVTREAVANLAISLPPLDEQKRIAGILDAADALRAKRREAFAQLDTLLQSTFLDMFGDPVTNPMGWTKVRSGELFLLPPKIGTITPAAGRGYLVVRVGEVGESRIAFERCGRVEISEKDFAKFRLERGDTVIARAIGSKNHLGKASFFADFDEATVIDSHVMRLRPDPTKCDGLWFYSLISSDRGKALLQQTGGATAVQFNINAKQASSVQVALPPLDLQHHFAAIAESVEHQKAVQRTHLAELDTLFASLQSRAFRGDL